MITRFYSILAFTLLSISSVKAEEFELYNKLDVPVEFALSAGIYGAKSLETPYTENTLKFIELKPGEKHKTHTYTVNNKKISNADAPQILIREKNRPDMAFIYELQAKPGKKLFIRILASGKGSVIEPQTFVYDSLTKDDIKLLRTLGAPTTKPAAAPVQAPVAAPTLPKKTLFVPTQSPEVKKDTKATVSTTTITPAEASQKTDKTQKEIIPSSNRESQTIPAGRGSLLSDIQQGTTLKKVEPGLKRSNESTNPIEQELSKRRKLMQEDENETPSTSSGYQPAPLPSAPSTSESQIAPSAPSREGLLSDIQKGKTLKRVEPNAPKTIIPKEDTAEAMRRVIEEKQRLLNTKPQKESTSSDEEWQ